MQTVSGSNVSNIGQIFPIWRILCYVTCIVASLCLYHSANAADIVVSTTADDFTVNGNCTLREAIESINAPQGLVDGCTNSSADPLGTNDTIILGAGFYKLIVPQAAGTAATDNHSGDLNIRNHLIIRGAGPGQTVISGKDLLSPNQDRIFVNALARVVELEEMTIESGVGDGGTVGMLIHNSSGSGTLTMRNLVLRDASGLSGAAAVYNNGNMTMSNVAVLQTRGTSAGAIHNNGGTLSLFNVTIAGTTATNNSSGTAGVIYNNDGTLNLTSVTLFENRWGIYSAGANATTTISNTVMAGNEQNCRGDLGTYISTGNNWSDDNSCAVIPSFGTTGIDPLLSDLTFATPAINPSGNVAGTIVVPPVDGSPLLAAGIACPPTDQTDAPRAAACTIGAYEGSVSAQAALSSIPAAAAGTINGVAYLDHNADGTIGALDPPVAGIVVSAYYAGGVVSTTTDAAGQYTLTVPSGTAARIEFSAIPASLTSGVYGSHSDTTVQFVTSPLESVNLALTNAATYCQDNPTLATSCYFFGDQSSGEGVLVSFPYDAGASGRDGDSATGSGGYDNPPHPELATDSEIGTTWGLAYQRTTDTWFAASFMKRHVGFGPTDDAGTIYQIGASGSPTVLTTLAAGANSHPNATANFTLDAAAFDAVGKIGLGDMDISTNDQTLYVVNLFDKNLYIVDIATGSSTSALIPLPTAANLFGAAQGCSNVDDVRPFALNVNPDDGLVYVGMVCSAEFSGNGSELRAYVYTFDGTTFSPAPVLEFALDYERGHAYNSGQSVSGSWLPWEPNPADVLANNVSQVTNRDDLISYPQPILADIEFDNGDMILAFMDRMGHQHGQCAPFPDGSTPADGGCDPNGYVVNPAGDLLRACPSGANAWTIEANASCGTTQTAGANNGQGPSDASGLPGEYYFMDEMTRAHREITSGGILQIAGEPDVASIVFDPIIWSNDFFAAGVHWTSNRYGTWQRSYRVFDTIEPFNLNNGIFGKSNGLGDLEAACWAAPIEIGNRVWFDANGDGVQDPDEAPIAGVTVNLYDPSGALIGTAITAGDGSYYFSSAPGTDSGNAVYSLSALDFDTAGYTVRLDNPNDYASGGPLDGIGLTVDNNDPSADGDVRDSDGTIIDGYPELTFDTGAPGDNNHTYDFGFRSLDVLVLKSAVPNIVLGGEMITYTIAYSEANGLATGAITITEQLPAQLTFLGQESATPAATLDASNPSQPTWIVPQLAHNTTGEIIFTALVDPTFTGTLLNSVAITTAGDMTLTNNVDTETTAVVDIGLDVEKSTNGLDADVATGPLVEVGQSVTWSYVVTNTGGYTLTGVTVADDLAGAVTCPSTTLPPTPDPAHAMSCTAIVDVATAGQYANVASASGTTIIDGTPHTAEDDDPSHYFGTEPAILVLKEPTLQAVPLGDSATFQIIVENSGNVALTNVLISDPLAPTCDTTLATLAVGERHSYTCTVDNVTAGFTNVITATGTPPIGNPVDDDDDADVIITTSEAFALAIDLEKSTNGVDADAAPGPYIEPGQPVTWTYQIENTGGYTLTNVLLSDSIEGTVVCPTATLFPAPGPGHSMTCTMTNIAFAGQYENNATVRADALIDGKIYEVSDADPSHYLGSEPTLTIAKDPPTQSVVAGGTANFIISVQNTGNVPLTNVQVSDPLAPGCDTTLALLAVGARHSYACTMGPLTNAGAITNVANVVGTPPIGPDVSDDDPAEVTVLAPPADEMPSIAVQKDPPQQTVNSGDVVTFTIAVTNTGNVDLTNVQITDPQAPACDATLAVLPVGQAFGYACAINSVSADFINTLFVQGESPSGVEVSDNDVAEVAVIQPEPPVTDPPPSGLTILKGPANQVVTQGDSATFYITVVNIGQTDLTNVTVIDPIAPNCDQTIDTLSAGGSMSYICTLDDVQTDLTNTIAATGESPNGPVSDDDSAEVIVTIVDSPPAEMPAIALDKVIGSAPLRVGDSATFTFTVRNTGNVDLSNVMVSDPLLPACDIQLPLLPAGLSFTHSCVDTSVTESYTNQAFVTAMPPIGPSVQDSVFVWVPVTQLASIGDYVWFDANANGVQDPDEEPLPNVRVELLDAEGNLIGITSTDADGRYLFDNLEADRYTVRFIAPDGYTFSPQTLGDPLLNSDADPQNGTTTSTVLEAGEQDLAWDAGLYRPSDVRLQKHSLTQVAAPGEVIIYSLSVTNFGLEAESNIVLTETVSLHTTFVQNFSTSGWSCADGSAAGTPCVYTIESLPANETVVASFAIRINANISPSDVSAIQNTAVIAGDPSMSTDFRTGFNEATFTVQVGVPTALDLAAEPDAPPTETEQQQYLPLILQQ